MRQTTTIEDVLAAGPILVLAPHPDDESLGCGLLLARAFAGHGAVVACLTDGGASHTGSATYPQARLAQIRRTELTRAIHHLGGTDGNIVHFDLPDSGAPCPAVLEDVASKLISVIKTRSIRTLFTTSIRDPHSDHKLASRIARQVQGRIKGLALYEFPVWSRWISGEPANAVQFDAPAARERKRKAIEAHASQQGRVIDDAVESFVFPEGFAAHFAERPEVFEEIVT